MSPKEYLEFLQLSVGLDESWVKTHSVPISDRHAKLKEVFDHTRSVGAESFEDFAKGVEENRSAALPFCSRYEDPDAMSIVLSLKRRIEDAFDELHFGELDSLVIGTLPSGEMNALAIKVPDSDEYVIALNRGLFTFLNLASKCMTQTIPTDMSQEKRPGYEPVGFKFGFGWRDKLRIYTSLPNPVAHFKDLFVNYLLRGDARRAAPYLLEPSRVRFYATCTHAMEIFILAHEVAHVLGKHGVLPKSFKESIKGQQVDTYWRDWKDEIQADVVAFDVTLKALVSEFDDWPPLLIFMAIEYLFLVMEFADRANNILRLGRDQETLGGSHPPASLRRMVLTTKAKNRAREGEREALGHVAKDIDARATFLWRRTRSTFFKHRSTSEGRTARKTTS